MRRLAAIGAAALAVTAVALGAPGVGRPTVTARPAATFTSGSFAQSNSRTGVPIFTAANLGPGDATTGSVTIANRGTLGGRFSLSAVDVSDVPGPNGGLLSTRLHMAVQDVTAPASPVTVYSGTLSAMSPRPLGYFRAGDAHTYRFTATLADGGSPPSPTGGDNAFAGSSTSVRFRWDALESPPPTRPPVAAPAGPGTQQPVSDRRPPRLRLTIPRLQPVLSRGYLVARARCSERCRIDVTGRARVGRARAVPTRPIRGRHGAPGRSTQLRIRMPRTVRGATLRRALLRDGSVTVRLRVVARDRAGNRSIARRTVRLRRR